MRLVIIVEDIPPFCGGAEQVAWTHAVELAKQFDVAVITFGESFSQSTREGVHVYHLPRRKHAFLSYSTFERQTLNRCIDQVAPDVIHCHMPRVLSACLRKRHRVLVSTLMVGFLKTNLSD